MRENLQSGGVKSGEVQPYLLKELEIQLNAGEITKEEHDASVDEILRTLKLGDTENSIKIVVNGVLRSTSTH